MDSLDAADREAGVVAASAGNHAQGVAEACRTLGIRGRIYVPGSTPRQKRERITAIGGELVELILVGDSFDDRSEEHTSELPSRGHIVCRPLLENKKSERAGAESWA